MVFPLVPQTQHVTSLLMTVNKPLSAVSLTAAASLAMTRLFRDCELGTIYYHSSHFESAINLEGNADRS